MDILPYDWESRKIGPAGRHEMDVSALKWFCFFWCTERSKPANPGFALMELQLIQSKADIENPQTIIEAEVR
jgi:hypothetical protein